MNNHRNTFEILIDYYRRNIPNSYEIQNDYNRIYVVKLILWYSYLIHSQLRQCCSFQINTSWIMNVTLRNFWIDQKLANVSLIQSMLLQKVTYTHIIRVNLFGAKRGLTMKEFELFFFCVAICCHNTQRNLMRTN